MKTVSYDGVAATTDDRVADAVLALATALARFNRYETVAFPVLIDDRTEELTLMLGPTIHISSLTLSSGTRTSVAGADEVVTRISARIEALTDPLHAVEDAAWGWAAS